MLPLNLDEWLEKLEKRLLEHNMLLGTDRMKAVLPLLIDDQPIAKKVITVAGTNGKGSTVAFLEHMLESSGLEYGATCSPHLFRYNERIRVNGQPVDDDIICDAFSSIEKARGDIFLSFFEFFALSAFIIFARRNLDVAILEIGLGGRLDAMNVIDPDIAVITTVDLDHQKWLGDTVEAIAAEKACIFRTGIPAIYGDKNVPESVQRKAEHLKAIALFRDHHFSVVKKNEYWIFRGINHKFNTVELDRLPLPKLPFTSAVCAVQAAMLLGNEISEANIKKGLSTAWLYGRNHCINFQNSRQQIINIRFDVAHNPQAGANLAATLEQQPCSGRRVALAAMLEGKDYVGTLEPLLNCFDEWNVSSVAYKPRSLSGLQLQKWLASCKVQVRYFPVIADATLTLLNEMKTGDELVVFGSFHTVEEAFLVTNL